ncbi:MAG: hypothetical protein CVU20_09300 [Betaproteobacteria bacterium HGW-Betaproteobacteria-14]|nr:MAG: hypothetical protein CVU20_09300 [Betaproteobacteria bacterium HGW-Betaproteobacteria-14]
MLDYFAAQERARKMAEELRHPSASTIRGKKLTVNDAIDQYLDWLRQHGKAIRETETTISAHIIPPSVAPI